MTAKMNNSFISYVDFIDLAYEAYNTAPRKVFTKIMRMITNSLHEQSVEIEKRTLQIEDMSSLPISDLDESSLVAIYGRRRIGKTYFVNHMFKKHRQDYLFFEQSFSCNPLP